MKWRLKILGVTTTDLGVLTRDTGNHIFKFSANHILSQSEKDGKEKRDLTRLVITMAEYIDSLINVGVPSLIQVPHSFDLNSFDSE